MPRPQNKLLSHKSRHEWCHTKLTTAAREERGDHGRAGLAELLQAVRTERLSTLGDHRADDPPRSMLATDSTLAAFTRAARCCRPLALQMTTAFTSTTRTRGAPIGPNVANTHSVQGDSPLVPWVPAGQVAAFVVSTRSKTTMARRAMWLGRFRIIVCQSNVAGVCRATVRNDCADNWNLACTAG